MSFFAPKNKNKLEALFYNLGIENSDNIYTFVLDLYDFKTNHICKCNCKKEIKQNYVQEEKGIDTYIPNSDRSENEFVNSIKPVNNNSDIDDQNKYDNNIQPNRLEIKISDNTDENNSISNSLDIEINKEVDNLKFVNIEANKNKPDRLKITESKRILKKVKCDYYEYYDKYFPDRAIDNFDNINKNIKTINTKHIQNIIEYYEICKKYLKKNDKKDCSKLFNKYIEFNTDFSVKYFSNLYEKVKKCYNFINYFEEQNISKDKIINLLYRSSLTYTKLFKIKGEEYEELKTFFIDKVNLLEIKIQPDNKIQPDRSRINRTTNKECPLSYIGTKHDYTNEINKYINIKDNNKIYDLFTGSSSIPYYLSKLYPDNKIIINDLNEYIINFYNELKNNKSELIEKIEELNTIENIKNYKILLNIINYNESTGIEKAAVYYILNKIAFNGKVFYDKDNKLNIHSYNKSSIVINKEKINNFSKFLNNIEINNKCLLNDMDYWLQRIDEGDIVILDPPYDILYKQNNHYLYNFDRNEQIRLSVFINKLIEKKAKILLFNGDTLFIRKLYKNLNINIIESNTRINKNKYYKELLIYN